ncbi:DUF1223 domain-containing protein [Aquimarina sp. MMG016]|uniref:DUF1223 domain-containing protein n=1 Tax=Aquimarina sp. MMG016 TaxID=2822690 RepID=UPI001B3A68FC|nr:DUF1223 domain-containing protein [Aquimarina sp. MMG016]MBQ4821362.1 DUF1223 domain-containing protein [Aquimarina sp. MMG016]
MVDKLLILLTLLISANLSAQQGDNSIIVLELFTSQGCSSCPPADELLDRIKYNNENQDVYVLSYHVDYWNRLGWRDPFSNSMFSDYQREYAQQFNSRSIYTPQLVVNGREHFTGSNEYKVTAALEQYSQSKPSNTILLQNIKKTNVMIQLDYKVQGGDFDRITLALVVSERITDISRGENRNRMLKNTNIVANRIVTQQDYGEVSIKIPDWIEDSDQLSIITYTQDTDLKTTGASRYRL